MSLFALTSNEKVALERLVDGTSLATVAEALAEIAFEKSAHLETNWQDARRAKVWSRAGERLSKVSCALHKFDV